MLDDASYLWRHFCLAAWSWWDFGLCNDVVVGSRWESNRGDSLSRLIVIRWHHGLSEPLSASMLQCSSHAQIMSSFLAKRGLVGVVCAGVKDANSTRQAILNQQSRFSILNLNSHLKSRFSPALPLLINTHPPCLRRHRRIRIGTEPSHSPRPACLPTLPRRR